MSGFIPYTANCIKLFAYAKGVNAPTTKQYFFDHRDDLIDILSKALESPARVDVQDGDFVGVDKITESYSGVIGDIDGVPLCNVFFDAGSYAIVKKLVGSALTLCPGII